MPLPRWHDLTLPCFPGVGATLDACERNTLKIPMASASVAPKATPRLPGLRINPPSPDDDGVTFDDLSPNPRTALARGPLGGRARLDSRARMDGRARLGATPPGDHSVF